jgi:hypothetical protein
VTLPRDELINRMRRDLQQIPDLYTLLNLFIVRGRTGENPGHTTPGSRPPLDLDVLGLTDERAKPNTPQTRLGDHKYGSNLDIDQTQWAWTDGKGRAITEPPRRRVGIIPTLAQWTLLIECEMADQNLNPPESSEQPTITTECAYLLATLDYAGHQDWLPDLAKDIHRIRGDLRHATNDHDTNDLHLACTGCGWPKIESMDGGTWYRCTGCDLSWPRAELSKRAERKRPRSLTQVAKAVGISRRQLQAAVEDGRLKHVAREGNTRLYDTMDAAAVAASIKLANRKDPS